MTPDHDNPLRALTQHAAIPVPDALLARTATEMRAVAARGEPTSIASRSWRGRIELGFAAACSLVYLGWVVLVTTSVTGA